MSGGYGYLGYFYQNNFDKGDLEPEQMFHPVGRAAVVVPESSDAPGFTGGLWSTSLLSWGSVLPRAAGCTYRCNPQDLGKKKEKLWDYRNMVC